ncbi:unnamed protein product [Callosobruchus maculatus]|uniref:Sugar phosphate phosphatase n=1 Tax=Callosobruchus maculatus TaxID=64391 RepID=A0A653CQS7_CALMS|nr:unnamed protein product [Callosobruchus maculatus]
MCECQTRNRSIDVKTPRNVHLSAFYKRSFAYHTVLSRMPIILTNLIDGVVKNKAKIARGYGIDATEDLKTVIGELSEFKYEVQTNQPLKPLTSIAPDAAIYNEYIAEQANIEGPPTHFHAIWLLTECYMYRRIAQIFENTALLKEYDLFRASKEESFTSSIQLIRKMAKHLTNLLAEASEPSKEEFVALLKLNLWGNKCDLSISLGKMADNSALFDTAKLDDHVLCDHCEDIWEAVSDTAGPSNRIAIVFDNAGYEVFTDLCIADYIISRRMADNVTLYVKTIPWFISDVMLHDLNWTLQQMKKLDDKYIKPLGEKWSDYIEDGSWKVIESDFWTLPYNFSHMAKVDPDLYNELGGCKVVIFKGDLNYRKLFGEMNWNPSTLVETGLQGFHPSGLAILRTIKSDVVCGLPEGVAETIEEQDPKWKEKGDWGLIQYCGRIRSINCV